jgi:hypothetical protein
MVDDAARLAVADDLRQAAAVAKDDHRPLEAQRLHRGEAEAFTLGGEDEDVHQRDQLASVLAIAGKHDAVADAEVVRALLQPGPDGAVPDDQQARRLVVERGESLQQEVQPLSEVEDGDRADDRHACRQAQVGGPRVQAPEIEAVVDDPDPAVADPVEVRPLAQAIERRDGDEVRPRAHEAALEVTDDDPVAQARVAVGAVVGVDARLGQPLDRQRHDRVVAVHVNEVGPAQRLARRAVAGKVEAVPQAEADDVPGGAPRRGPAGQRAGPSHHAAHVERGVASLDAHEVADHAVNAAGVRLPIPVQESHQVPP